MFEGTITGDLHTHLNEKRVKPRKYWAAVVERGLDAVAITEHAENKPRKAFERLAAEKPDGIALVPGIELRTSIGHVLAFSSDKNIFGFPELLKKNLPIGRALEIAGDNGFLLSVSHPWGFKFDSAAHFLGADGLLDFVQRNGLGVEVFNGMIGNLADFVFESEWIVKPKNFFDFLEKNRLARKTRVLSFIGARLKKKIDLKTIDVLYKNAAALELGKAARFVTAGSDAHSAERIGLGIMKIKHYGEVSAQSVLDALQRKENVVWSGPFVREVKSGILARDEKPLKRMEIIQGLNYAAKKAVLKAGFGKKPAEKVL